MIRFFFIVLLFLFCLRSTAQTYLPRHPNLDEVATYLRAYLQNPPQGFISYFWPDEENALLYADVNGDGEEDLIAQGWLFVAIMLWEGETYSEPFQHIMTANPDSGAWSNVKLEDWTLDNRPEIVFDLRQNTIGENSGRTNYQRSLISCSSQCRIIWQEMIADYFWASGAVNGIYLYQSEMQVFRDETGQIWLDLISRDFAFNCRLAACRVSQELAAPDSFAPASRVGAVLRQRYRWDGLRFNRDTRLSLVDAYPIAPQSQLVAVHEENSVEIIQNETCQIWLNGQAIGANFSCLVDFTRLYWRDLTGDGQPELLLEYAYFDSEILRIYNRDGQELGEIRAAIREADLFGIRVAERGIFTAGATYTNSCDGNFCWYELNQETVFYQWDGRGFKP